MQIKGKKPWESGGLPYSLNLVVRQHLWAPGIRAINQCITDGVKHGNPADSQVNKYWSSQAIFGDRMPGCPLILYTDFSP